MISRSLSRCIQLRLTRAATSGELAPLTAKKSNKLRASRFMQHIIYSAPSQSGTNFQRFCSTIRTAPVSEATEEPDLMRTLKAITGSDQCPGCGTQLQVSAPEHSGYIPPAVLSRVLSSAGPESRVLSSAGPESRALSSAGPESRVPNRAEPVPSDARHSSLLCQRCYKLVHYNTPSRADAAESEERLVARVTRVDQDRAAPLVALLVDLSDVEGSLLARTRLKTLLPTSTPLVLIATKVDVLPAGVSETRVVSWLRDRATALGLEPRAVLVTSAVTGHNVTHRHLYTGHYLKAVKLQRQARAEGHEEHLLLDHLRHHAQGRNIVFMGVQNVGKSSLVNRLLRRAEHVTAQRPAARALTTSYFPGTTLAPIARPLMPLVPDPDTASPAPTPTPQFIYDTPGLVPNQPHMQTALMASNVHQWQQHAVLSHVVLDKRIKPAVYRLSPGRTLYLGGLARIDYLSGPLAYFTVFASHALYVHETGSDKAAQVWQSGADKFLTPVLYGPDRQPLPLQSRDLTLRSSVRGDEAFVDLVWPGLGWIALTAAGELRVRVAWALDPSGIVLREPIMPFESKAGLKPNPRFQAKPAY